LQKRESTSFKTKWAEFESKLRQLASSAETGVDERDDSDIERSRRKWGWLITLFAALAMVSGIVFAPPEVCCPQELAAAREIFAFLGRLLFLVDNELGTYGVRR
jgi:hypothetical protein